MSWLNDAKVITAEDKTAERSKRNKDEAKTLRDSTIISDIEVHGVFWQVRDKDRGLMKEALRLAGRKNKNSSTNRMWILADNSFRLTTAEDLEQVLDAYTERVDTIFNSYAIWQSGDMSEPFVI